MSDETSLERIEQKLDALAETVAVRLGDVNAGFKGVDARFDKVDARFDKVDARFDKVDARFDKVDARFDDVDARFGDVDARFGDVDARFGDIDLRLTKLTVLHEETRTRLQLVAEGVAGTIERVERLEVRMDERFDGVDRRFDSVDERLHCEQTLSARADARITALERRPPAARK